MLLGAEPGACLVALLKSACWGWCLGLADLNLSSPSYTSLWLSNCSLVCQTSSKPPIPTRQPLRKATFTSIIGFFSKQHDVGLMHYPSMGGYCSHVVGGCKREAVDEQPHVSHDFSSVLPSSFSR